jgi:uncharacterized protein YukE
MSVITYSKAHILESASRVAQNAAGMADDHQDVSTRTAALMEAFSGINASTYIENQVPFMQSFDHLIQTVNHFVQTVHTIVDNITDTDNNLATSI